MSVYKHPNGKTYSYDFTLPLPSGERERFRGSTEQTTERKAKQVESEIRAREWAKIQGLPVNKGKRLPDMPLREAFGRFWNEKGQFEKNHKSVFGQLARMMERLGPDTLLSRLTTDDLTRYQSQRRRDMVKRKGELQPIGNRTVNAEVPELLSRVYDRAKLWRVDRGELGEKDFDWSKLKLGVPQHRTRAASRLERIRLFRSLRLDYRPIMRFALRTGLRKTALLVKRDQIIWDAGVFWYPKKSKHTGDRGWLPITPEIEKIFKREIEKGGEDCEWVFTYICRRSRGERKRGERYPITGAGLREAMEEAVAAAGLEDWRLIHDMRHTSATETLRETQNLALVQQMLGHTDIAQTSRYAHVLMEDLRQAMSRR